MRFLLAFFTGCFLASYVINGQVKNVEDAPPPKEEQLSISDIKPVSTPKKKSSSNRFKSSRRCHYGTVDLYFVVDSSDSVGRHNFAAVLAYIKNRVQELSTVSSHSRFGVTQFTYEKQTLEFDLLTPVKEIKEKVLNLTHLHGSTSVKKGMLFTLDQFTHENGDRPDVENVMMVFTDTGDHTHAYPQAEAAGVKVMAVGAGKPSKTDPKVLLEIVGHKKYNVLDIMAETDFAHILGLECGTIQKIPSNSKTHYKNKVKAKEPPKQKPIIRTCKQLQNYNSQQKLEVKDCTVWNDTLYWRFETRMTWRNAEKACKKVGGHLASIHSFDEKRLLNDFAENTESKYWPGPWIGLHRKNFTCSDTLVWTDGTDVDYSDWLEGAPDCGPQRPYEGCVQIASEGNSEYVRFGWNDFDCDGHKKSICKMKRS